MLGTILKFLGIGGQIISAIVPGGILGQIGSIIKKVSDTPETAEQMQKRVDELAAKGELEEISNIAKIIQTEVQGENWLQRNWRPILMLIIGAIIANTFLIIPILNLFLTTKLVIVLPDAFYDLLMVGLGGYILGRSAEKILNKNFNKTNNTGIGNWKNPDEV